VGVDWTSSFLLPKWACVVLVAVLLLLALANFVRGPDYSWNTSALRISAVILTATLGATAIELLVALNNAAERRLLNLQVSQLRLQALAPGSPLVCLDMPAPERLQPSCEKALFNSAEATRAAVAYVAAQLSLLEAAKHQGQVHTADEGLASVRRAVEADRFGFVAHVLASSYGCSPQSCERLGLLEDARRVRANLVEGLFASYLTTHMAEWSMNAAQEAPPPPVAMAKPSSKLFVPSSASIPPVSIMTAEPSARTQAAEPTAAPESASQSRKPPSGNSEARPAGGVNSGGTRGSPLQISPGAQ
jgi:hypothetical protein